ncbi:MAG TPA: glycoside hydrolase family 2 TIM barrel-domain containing protein, partial [Acidisarcina sp.]
MRLRALWAAPLFLVFATTTVPAFAVGPVVGADIRQQIPLTGGGWTFVGASAAETLPESGTPAFAAAAWSPVSVPHVFNSRLDYDRLQQGWYRRVVVVPPGLATKRLFLVFEGVTSIADVYVNGHHMGQHRGAYTRFIFDATSALHPGGGNEIAVRVDNRVSEIQDLFPNRTRLYKLWGGINRKVWLLATDSLHIDPTDFASPGVYITPSNVTAESARISVEVLLRDDSPASAHGSENASGSVRVRASVLDPAGKVVKVLNGPAEVKSGARTAVTLAGTVDHPWLWEPGHPYVYHVRVELLRGGKVVDVVTQPTGFRTVDFDFPGNKIVVNGKRTKFFGADVHQELEPKGNAVSDDDIRSSFDTMQDLGVNFMRLPHYPHAQLEYDLCDERGIFCWAENGHSNDEKWGPAGEQITTEMVKQNYNHPSIPLWSVGNESRGETAEAAVPLVRALDPSRPVVVANMRCNNCDLRGINTYPGWYGKLGFRDYTPHGFITEVGGGGVVTTHTDYNQADYVVNKFEPEEYQQLVAENDISKALNPANEDIAMFTWWTLRDFSDTKYKGPIGINSKGLLTYAGDKKDVYYLYRSFLRPGEPTVHITSKRYFLRRGAVDNGIKVYSNAKKLTLTLNGAVVSTLENGKYFQPGGPYLARTLPAKDPSPQEIDNVFYWPVPLHTGRNDVSISDGAGHSDSAVIYFEGAGGSPARPSRGTPLVEDLTSSNANNPAYIIDAPIHAQWPIYYDLDGTADNS